MLSLNDFNSLKSLNKILAIPFKSENTKLYAKGDLLAFKLDTNAVGESASFSARVPP